MSRVKHPLGARWQRGRAVQTRTLLQAMAARATRWWITGGFERRDFLTLDGARWTVCYKLHLAPVSWPGVALASSITLWPPETKKGVRSGAAGQWRTSVARQLRRFGYSGSWPKGPSGEPFGDFWKGHASARAALEEVDFLESLSNRRQLFPGEGTLLKTQPLR